MGRSRTATLPIIPLARASVLLPGLIQRISVNSSRPDIPALLAHVYEQAAARGPDGRIDAIPIACVPLSSPFVGPAGQLLINNGEEIDASQLDEVNPGNANKSDIFGFGVAAKIIGIDGRGAGEFALRVEGTSRVRVDNVVRDRPFFQGRVTYYSDESESVSGEPVPPVLQLTSAGCIFSRLDRTVRLLTGAPNIKLTLLISNSKTSSGS